MKPILIEDNQTLTQFCNKLINEPLLAIDTEFFRETTYYPHLGLIQIASPSDIICIDPLAFDARDELRRLFFNTDITKVLHSCSQDMEVLYQYFGELPAPIFDTQIAAAMLGYQDQIGYAKLVAEEYDVELDKSQTRTNWLKRPLSAKQIEYAGEDVLYLLPLYEKFSSALTEKTVNSGCRKTVNSCVVMNSASSRTWKTAGNGLRDISSWKVCNWRYAALLHNGVNNWRCNRT